MTDRFVFAFDNDPTGRIPRWGRTVFRGGDGEIFLPAFLADSEAVVFLKLGWEGERAIFDEDHLYAPGSWMAREYPQLAEIIKKRRWDILDG